MKMDYGKLRSLFGRTGPLSPAVIEKELDCGTSGRAYGLLLALNGDERDSVQISAPIAHAFLDLIPRLPRHIREHDDIRRICFPEGLLGAADTRQAIRDSFFM